VLIKVGQFLSARVDVLPESVTAELAGLQDEVPPRWARCTGPGCGPSTLAQTQARPEPRSRWW
jgi:hypothetical protein